MRIQVHLGAQSEQANTLKLLHLNKRQEHLIGHLR